jgi:hypothetical protein
MGTETGLSIRKAYQPIFYFAFLHKIVQKLGVFGGGKRDRTADLLHAMQALSQLSYTPKIAGTAKKRNYKSRISPCQILTGIYLYFQALHRACRDLPKPF